LRTRAVRINITNINRNNTGFIHGNLHRFRSTASIGRRRRHMIRIACASVSDDFSIYLRITLQCMFQAFKNQNPRAFTHNKTVPFFIEWD
jgi:hypothetical protein